MIGNNVTRYMKMMFESMAAGSTPGGDEAALEAMVSEMNKLWRFMTPAERAWCNRMALNVHLGVDAGQDLGLHELAKINRARSDRWHKGGSPWTLADWSNALCGEAGELANVIKKIRRHDTGIINDNAPPRSELLRMAGEELADVILYADLMARALSVDLADAVRNKFNKVSEKYGFEERL